MNQKTQQKVQDFHQEIEKKTFELTKNSDKISKKELIDELDRAIESDNKIKKEYLEEDNYEMTSHISARLFALQGVRDFLTGKYNSIG
jgi:predicted AlkP superfamily phosphohydrolase/phosphomutase